MEWLIMEMSLYQKEDAGELLGLWGALIQGIKRRGNMRDCSRRGRRLLWGD